MNRLNRLFPFSGPAIVTGYGLLALAAYLFYPGPFSPLQNWLSDLGDINQNPRGAVLYNLGIILTGLLAVIFFLSLSKYKVSNRKAQNWMVVLTQTFGILGSLAMVMSGIFPISNLEFHRIWSISLYILLGTAFVFSLFALRYFPECPGWVFILGGAAALVDILSGVFHEFTLLEWITVVLFLGYLFTLNVKIFPRLNRT